MSIDDRHTEAEAEAGPEAAETASASDERVAALVNEYFDRRQAGEDLTPEAFLEEHSELADILRPYLDGLNLLEQIRSAATASEGNSRPSISEPVLPAIDGYEVLAEIGRGGMGVVYRALQDHTKRMVAIKVMLTGPFASPNTRRRFEREIELAARLRHPSIVTVLESGQVITGQKYFAMDFVKGRPLDQFLQEEKLDVRSTVELFLRICQAAEYAHRHGVIHRDLKPANVLIDDEGNPHVMDFGLAKTLDDAEAEEALTRNTSAPGQVMGTLKYLSPEQAGGRVNETDVRTDVYALTVMLYEALTGALPYETAGRPSEVAKRIQEQSPRRPAVVSDKVDHELETILLMGLEKERERRYQLVGQMGEDLRRYLTGEPILAKRASRFYVLRKKVYKHRWRLVAACVSVVLAAVSTYVAVHWADHAQRQRAAAERYEARRQVLRVQRKVEGGFFTPEVLAEAYQTLGLHPTVPEARLVVAQSLIEDGFVEREAYRRAAKPEDDPAEEPDPWEQAITFLREELRRNPGDWPSKMMLANVYRDRDMAGDDDCTGEEECLRSDQDLADELMLDVKREAPDTAEAWYVKSFAELSRNPSFRCVYQAAQREPESRLAWERFAYLAKQLGEFASALDAVDRLRGLEPEVKEWRVLRHRIMVSWDEEKERRLQAPAPARAGSADLDAGETEEGPAGEAPLPENSDNVSISSHSGRGLRVGQASRMSRSSVIGIGPAASLLTVTE